MSRLEELMRELCPNGVPYKKLGEIATDIYRGSGIKREQITPTGTPCVRYGEIYTTYGIWFDECVSHTDAAAISSPKYFEYGDILFVITGESVEDIAKSTAYVGHERCLAGGDIVVLKHTQNPKYLSYALATTNARKQKSSGKVKSKVVHSSVPAIKDIVLPLPPLPVQNEIVRILDNFTELTAELTAELAARKKQYEYYRDKLLTFDVRGGGTSRYSNGVVWRTPKNTQYMEVQDLFEFKNGLNKGKEFFGTGTPIVNFTDVFKSRWLTAQMLSGRVNVTPTEIERYGARKGDVFFTRTSETQEDIGMTSVLLEDVESCVFSGFVLRARPKTNLLLPKFSSYFFSSSDARKQIVRTSTFTTRALTSGSKLAKIKVPIPPLPVQHHIVDILDRFDALCNDLTSGLPAEIAARQKQYEYYRDKLLAFKELTP